MSMYQWLVFIIAFSATLVCRGSGLEKSKSVAMPIAMVSVIDMGKSPSTMLYVNTLQEYAKYWGCSWFIYEHSKNLDRHKSWAKVRLLLNHLENETEESSKNEWFCWIDDTVSITDKTLPLSYFINTAPADAQIIIARDSIRTDKKDNLDTSIFLIKNSEWSRTFLKDLWNMGFTYYKKDGEPVLAYTYEKEAFIELVKNKKYQNSSSITYLPACSMRSSLSHTPSFAMITISTPNRSVFSQYSLQSFKAYCWSWGYKLFIYDKSFDETVPAPWSKIKAVLDLQEDYKDKKSGFDWFCWIDDDIFITNPKLPLQAFIEEYGKDAHVIISAHKRGTVACDDVNTGLFFVRNSEWSRNFLRKIWEIRKYRYNQPTGSCLEQSALGELINTDEYKDNPFIVHLPAGIIQSYITMVSETDDKDYGQWEPGDFAAHLAAASTSTRTMIMEQLVRNSFLRPALPSLVAGYKIS